MNADPTLKRILLIDRQDSWRERSARALHAAGFDVHMLNHYNYPPSAGNGAHDLVILGCASIGDEERDLIMRILEQHDHLLVLSTLMPWQVMRSLFLIGASDVADKPYDADHLVSTVNQLFRSIASEQ